MDDLIRLFKPTEDQLKDLKRLIVREDCQEALYVAFGSGVLYLSNVRSNSYFYNPSDRSQVHVDADIETVKSFLFDNETVSPTIDDNLYKQTHKSVTITKSKIYILILIAVVSIGCYKLLDLQSLVYIASLISLELLYYKTCF